MNAQTTTLKQVAAGAAPSTRQRPDTFPAMLEAYRGEIARALPQHLKADTMMRIALTCFRMTPRLADCAPASVFACVIQASQLGLRPNMLGEAYLIPYKQRDEGYICTLQLGYQGMLELVRRTGLVESIEARVVHKEDAFDVQWGTTPGISHRPYLDGDAGPLRLVYAVARLKGGGTHAELMTLADIERIRDRSANVTSARRLGKATPWDTDFDEMARKTVLRRICKFLPKSTELATAIALDDAAYRGQQRLTVADAISNAFVPPPLGFDDVDPTTGETGAPPPPPATTESSSTRRRRSPAVPPPSDEPPPPNEEAGPVDNRPSVEKLAAYERRIDAAKTADDAELLLDEARGQFTPDELDALSAYFEAKYAG